MTTAFHIGQDSGSTLSGTRLALWAAGLLVLAAGLNTRRLLHRYPAQPTRNPSRSCRS